MASPNLIFDSAFGLLIPEIALRHVVLPLPEGPFKSKIPPSLTEKFIIDPFGISWFSTGQKPWANPIQNGNDR